MSILLQLPHIKADIPDIIPATYTGLVNYPMLAIEIAERGLYFEFYIEGRKVGSNYWRPDLFWAKVHPHFKGTEYEPIVAAYMLGTK